MDFQLKAIEDNLEQVEQLLALCASCLFDECPAIITAQVTAGDTEARQAALCEGNLHASANIAANSALEKVREIRRTIKSALTAEQKGGET